MRIVRVHGQLWRARGTFEPPVEIIDSQLEETDQGEVVRFELRAKFVCCQTPKECGAEKTETTRRDAWNSDWTGSRGTGRSRRFSWLR